MRLRLRILGVTVWSLELDDGPAAVEYEECGSDAVDETEHHITGGSAHDFERDLYPPDAQGEEPCYWDRAQGFGFQ